MSHFSLPVSVCLALGLGASVAAAQGSEPQAEPAPLPAARQTETLATLFVELKREGDESAARRISERIWAKWRDSGSATANLLMVWAEKAISDKKNGLALDFLDQVIVLMPDYVEGWNRRATLHYMMGNHAKSMIDINRVLTLEPRHFGALAGMAAIFTENGNDKLALRAWEQMLEIYPADRNAQARVGELSEKLSGSRT